MIFDHDSVLKVQKEFSTEITVTADLELPVVSSGGILAIVNYHRRPKPYILAYMRSVLSQGGRNQLCWQEHQGDINSLTTIDYFTSLHPQSKEEIDKQQS